MSIVDIIFNCQSAEKRFIRLSRRYDPSGYDPVIVHHNGNEWMRALEEALDNLLDAIDALAIHSSALEQGILEGWQSKVSNEESSFKELCNKIGNKLGLSWAKLSNSWVGI